MKAKTGEAEKKYTYEKTLLYAYPYLGRMSEAIGRETEVKAALSYRRENTERVVEELLDGIFQREILQEIGRKIGEILKEFSKEERYLLEYKFFRRKRKLIAYGEDVLSQLSERTIYRRQKEILKKFSALSAIRGINERWFSENLLPMDWMEAIYRRVEAGDDFRVAGKHKSRPFLRRRRESGTESGTESETGNEIGKDQGASSLEKPYSSAAGDCSPSRCGRRR